MAWGLILNHRRASKLSPCLPFPGAGMTVSKWVWSSFSLSPESVIFTTAVYLSITSLTTPFFLWYFCGASYFFTEADSWGYVPFFMLSKVICSLRPIINAKQMSGSHYITITAHHYEERTDFRFISERDIIRPWSQSALMELRFAYLWLVIVVDWR